MILAKIEPVSIGDFEDMTIPISSFQVQIESGTVTFVQAVVPGLEHAGNISDRADGILSISRASDGDVVNIGSLPITAVRIDKGARNQSIMIQASA